MKGYVIPYDKQPYRIIVVIVWGGARAGCGGGGGISNT